VVSSAAAFGGFALGLTVGQLREMSASDWALFGTATALGAWHGAWATSALGLQRRQPIAEGITGGALAGAFPDLNAPTIMDIVVAGERDLREVTEIARRQIKENIETIRGVGSVTMVGGLERAINIDVDTNRLSAYNISIEQVKAAQLTYDYDDRYGATTGPWTMDMFVEAVYTSLKQGRPKASGRK